MCGAAALPSLNILHVRIATDEMLTITENCSPSIRLLNFNNVISTALDTADRLGYCKSDYVKGYPGKNDASQVFGDELPAIIVSLMRLRLPAQVGTLLYITVQFKVTIFGLVLDHELG